MLGLRYEILNLRKLSDEEPVRVCVFVSPVLASRDARTASSSQAAEGPLVGGRRR